MAERLRRAHETLAAETRMLLRHHPEYPWSDYVRDHERLFDALERRDPNAPDLVVEHLRLSARLIGDERAAVANLASGLALEWSRGAYVTGTTIVVDGGADAWGLAEPPPEPERR